MPNRCVVKNCSTYKRNVSVFRFPQNEEEKTLWWSLTPKKNPKLELKKHTVICSDHFPEDCEFVTVHGRKRPAVPPSIWKNIQASEIPSKPAPLRTKRTHAEVRGF